MSDYRDSFRKLAGLRSWHPSLSEAVTSGESAEPLTEERLTEAANATVETFLTVLTSKLTQYDSKRTGKSGHNPYALSQYLGAAQDARDEVQPYLHRDDAEALGALKSALAKVFVVDHRGKAGLPPVQRVFDQIDAWLEGGKLPSLTK